MTQDKPKKINYLNNKDILKEIHKSKLTYCYSEDTEKFNNYDVIVDSAEDIFSNIQTAKNNKAAKMQSESYASAMLTYDSTNYRNKPKQKDFLVDPNSLDTYELVFRVMTFDHIPEELDRKKTHKTISDSKAKIHFPPFKHFVITDLENKKIREVVRSHWQGSLSNGKFSIDHGRITNKLGTMFLKLVERYSHRANWRGYTYVDEMRSHALVQLSQIGLYFDESKSANPFAYYTAAITNSFTRVLNLEKRNQNLRDDLLQQAGQTPSFTRQMDDEAQQRKARETKESDYHDKMEQEMKDAGYNVL